MNRQIMQKNILLLVALCILTLSGYAQKRKEITILHTNDVHSRIEPLEEKAADKRAAGKGGFIRVVNFVEEIRKENRHLLLFDSGDFSQGTPYFNLFKGDVEIELMNAAGYDAITIGNHEFDLGMDNLARLFRKANFPVVCANYDVKGTVLEEFVKPYVILERKGLKIGVFGLGTRLEGMVQSKNCEGVTFHEPYEIANEVAALLKKKGCDLVICLSHLGYRPTAKDPVCDIALVQKTRNIDIVLGGHSHTLMREPKIHYNLDGQRVYIQQVGRSAICMGRIDLVLTK